MAAQKDVGTVSRQLEEKLAEVTAQLEEQADLHKRAVNRAKKVRKNGFTSRYDDQC